MCEDIRRCCSSKAALIFPLTCISAPFIFLIYLVIISIFAPKSLHITQTQPNYRVKHQWILSSTKRFVLVDSYVVKDKEKGLLVVGNGAGKGPYTKKKGRARSEKSVCIFTVGKHKNDMRTYQTVAQFHLNGTQHLGIPVKHGQKKFMKYDRQVQVMFTCPLPISKKDITLVKGKGDVLPALKDISLVLKAEGDNSKASFAVQNIILKWAVPEDKFDKYKLVLCASPMWQSDHDKITQETSIGAHFMVEWFEYWKALGVDHMHIYDFNLAGKRKELIEYYQKTGFITVHDWSRKLSHGVTKAYGAIDPKHHRLDQIHSSWNYAQALTSQDCYWRTKNVSTHVIFADLDEVLFLPSEKKTDMGLAQVLSWCTEEFKKSKGKKLGFSLESVTTPPFLEPEYNKDAFLLLSRMPYREKKCRTRFNCGKYHYGMRKYILRTSQDADSLYVSIWHHAINRDYTLSDERMVNVEQSLAYIRHYNFQSKNVNRAIGALKDKKNEQFEPIQSVLLQHVERTIRGSPVLFELHEISVQKGSLLFSLRKK